MVLSIVSYFFSSLEPGSKGVFFLFFIENCEKHRTKNDMPDEEIISKVLHLSTTKQDTKNNTGKFLDWVYCHRFVEINGYDSFTPTK